MLRPVGFSRGRLGGPTGRVQRRPSGSGGRGRGGDNLRIPSTRNFFAHRRYVGGRAIPKGELLSERYSPPKGYWQEHPLAPEIDEIAAGSFKSRKPPEIEGSGYVVKRLEAAPWAFHHTDSFRDGCLLAVNLGDDADTTGAIYGQLAGAFYGADELPV